MSKSKSSVPQNQEVCVERESQQSDFFPISSGPKKDLSLFFLGNSKKMKSAASEIFSKNWSIERGWDSKPGVLRLSHILALPSQSTFLFKHCSSQSTDLKKCYIQSLCNPSTTAFMLGSGCGSVGRVVASNFKDGSNPNIMRKLFLPIVQKRRKCRKRGREWPIFKKF